MQKPITETLVRDADINSEMWATWVLFILIAIKLLLMILLLTREGTYYPRTKEPQRLPRSLVP